MDVPKVRASARRLPYSAPLPPRLAVQAAHWLPVTAEQRYPFHDMTRIYVVAIVRVSEFVD